MPTAAIESPIRLQPIPLRERGVLALGSRPLVMGVLNITPDSFSDGGRWLEPDLAVARADAMVGQGADLLDLGAESTRPGGGVYGTGASYVPAKEELDRLLPILRSVRERVSKPISVDTRKASVARAALAAGADIVNDISALAEEEMGTVVADAGCPVVLMHSRGQLGSMQSEIDFDHVVDEVVAEMAAKIERAVAFGIDRQRVLIDPGIGFGKTAEQNLQLLRHLDRIGSLGQPLVVGASRKSFIGAIAQTGPEERLPGSLAAVAWAASHQTAIIRVHDVAETVQFLDVYRAIDTAVESGQ